LNPNEGVIGNDVTNEEEEKVIDKDMEELKGEQDHHYPTWTKTHEDTWRNWTDWYKERMHLNITRSHNASGFPSFDHEDFKNFLNNRFNASDRMRYRTKRPVDNSGISSMTSDTSLKTVSLTDGIQYDVLGSIWHNNDYFTQGLSFSKGVLYESVGLYGHSKVCRINPEDGTAQKCVSIPARFFAEGMQVYGKDGEERLIQITWKEQTGWIRDVSTLGIISEFTFSTTNNEVRNNYDT
jgi:hypothetical protein